MARQLVSEQTTTEYFKEMVEEALTERQLQAGDLTEFYLVNLLCQYVRPDSRADHLEQAEPLAFRLGRALETGGSEQRARLRSLGDFSLFMSGFFSDSFRRSLVDVDYYKSMGEYAYGSLSRSEHDTFAQVFGELSSKFVGFMDVLSHYQRTNRDHARFGDGHPPPLREVAADRQRARRPAAGRARAAPEPVDRSPVRSVDQPHSAIGCWTRRGSRVLKPAPEFMAECSPSLRFGHPWPMQRPTTGRDKVSPGRQQPDVRPARCRGGASAVVANVRPHDISRGHNQTWDSVRTAWRRPASKRTSCDAHCQ